MRILGILVQGAASPPHSPPVAGFRSEGGGGLPGAPIKPEARSQWRPPGAAVVALALVLGGYGGLDGLGLGESPWWLVVLSALGVGLYSCLAAVQQHKHPSSVLSLK
jgi:hypothetical protein